MKPRNRKAGPGKKKDGTEMEPHRKRKVRNLAAGN
jgi:hypothetical protein